MRPDDDIRPGDLVTLDLQAYEGHVQVYSVWAPSTKEPRAVGHVRADGRARLLIIAIENDDLSQHDYGLVLSMGKERILGWLRLGVPVRRLGAA